LEESTQYIHRRRKKKKKKQKMPKESFSIDYVMEKASGPHFSGLRLEGLLSPTAASPRAPATPHSASSILDTNASNQPFVIGNFLGWTLILTWIVGLLDFLLKPFDFCGGFALIL